MPTTNRDRPVLILGAGINGAAIARELALNGVGVVIVDRGDIAGGATAYSSRLIHGGLRYLEYGEFSLVRESLAERGRLLKLAPQFVRPLRLFIPVKRRWSGIGSSAKRFLGCKQRSGSPSPDRGLTLVRMGLTLYDLFAKTAEMPRHGAARVGSPGSLPVDEKNYRWLCHYHDAQIEFPERFVVALLEDARAIAAQRGTRFEVHTYKQARLAGDAATIEGAADGARDVAGEFQPAAVINATGAWVDRTLQRLGVAGKRLMGGTKGSHLVTSHPALRKLLGDDGVYAEANDGRPVFILPLGGAVLIGTTDLPFEGDPALARADEGEIEYLLGVVKQVFPQIVLTASDIDFHYSGVRPLPYSGAEAPAGVTRRHWVETHEDATSANHPPMFSIIGGKLTTCRSLAEDTVAKVLGKLDWPVEANSRERPIPGDGSYPKDSDDAATAAIESEWVTRLSDLVERRLMLLYDPRLSTATLERLSRLMVAAGKLSEDQAPAEVEACRQRLFEQFGKSVT
jgi:glycerol-3-phosphate dehydrogenase